MGAWLDRGGAVSGQRLWWTAGLTVLVLVVLIAWWLWPAPEDAAWARIQQTGAITFATDGSYPPFTAIDGDGQLYGFDIELARAIADRMGLEARFDVVSYDGLLGTLTVGRSEAVLSAFVADDTRLHLAAYATPYFNAGTVLVQPSTDPPATVLPDWAAGQTLVVVYGSQGDVLLRGWQRRVPGIDPLSLPDERSALDAVVGGSAVGALIDGSLAYEYLGDYPTLTVTAALEDLPYVVAVHPESPTLLAELNRVLGDLEADGTLPALRTAWFGPDAATLRWQDSGR